MEPPASPPPPPPFPPDPDKLKKVFEGWSGLVGAVVASIAGALAVIGVDKDDAVVAAGLGLTVAAGASGVFWWRRRRAARSVRRPVASETVKARTSGFRLLQRFREGDHLPGDLRRRLAEDLMARVSHDGFDLIVVHGESGAGKSSLLAAGLAAALGSAGHPVELVRTLAGTAAERSGVTPVVDRLADLTARLRGNSERKSVLILDQFEELLARVRDDDGRRALGRALRAAIDSGVGVVIGIRKEHLDDLFDVTAHIGREFSTKEDLFRVRNFTPSEAASVIAECAARDGDHLDPALADMIVTDIATDQTVRPADLQVVCSMLHGELTEANYLKNLRAVGLRSRFIQHYAEDTGNPTLALTILRALCDVPAASKAPPQGVPELLDIARSGAPGPAVTRSEVERTLRALREGWIVVDNGDPETPRWSLLHDYLVEPIKLATDAMATAAQKATAELDHHLRQAGSGTVIPLDRLRIIRRDVPPARLLDQDVRRLVRRSLVRGYGRPTAVYGLTAVVCVSVFAMATTNYGVWGEHGVRVSHGGDGRESIFSFNARTEKSGRYGITESFHTQNSKISVWDRTNGAIIRLNNVTIYDENESLNELKVIDWDSSKIVSISNGNIDFFGFEYRDNFNNDRDDFMKEKYKLEYTYSNLLDYDEQHFINWFGDSRIFGVSVQSADSFALHALERNIVREIFSSSKYLRYMPLKDYHNGKDIIYPINRTSMHSRIIIKDDDKKCCKIMFIMKNKLQMLQRTEVINAERVTKNPPEYIDWRDYFEKDPKNFEKYPVSEIELGKLFSDISQEPGFGQGKFLLMAMDLERSPSVERYAAFEAVNVSLAQTSKRRIMALRGERDLRLAYIEDRDFDDPSRLIRRIADTPSIPLNNFFSSIDNERKTNLKVDDMHLLINRIIAHNNKAYLEFKFRKARTICPLSIDESISISYCYNFIMNTGVAPEKNIKFQSREVRSHGNSLAVWRKTRNELMVWQRGTDQPVRWKGPDWEDVTYVAVSHNHKGLISNHADGRVAIWFRPLDEAPGTPVRVFGPNLKISTSLFTADSTLALFRIQGGEYRVFTRTGEELGSLGTLGSPIVQASYSEACRRLFIWTEDGERIEFRRGVELPGRLFIPWSRLAGTGPECVTAGEIPLPPATERLN